MDVRNRLRRMVTRVRIGRPLTASGAAVIPS